MLRGISVKVSGSRPLIGLTSVSNPISSFWATPYTLHSFSPCCFQATILAQANTTPAWTIRTASQRASLHLQSFGEKAKVYTYQIGKRFAICSRLCYRATLLWRAESRIPCLAWRVLLYVVYWIFYFSCSPWQASQSSQWELRSFSDLHPTQCLSLILPLPRSLIYPLYMSK